MSGLAVYFEPNQITLATDTLVSQRDGLSTSDKGVNSLSKVNYYQHLRCCVVVLGYKRLGLDFYAFINSLVLSEIIDLISLTEKYFLSSIDVEQYKVEAHFDLKSSNHLGSLFIMGFSEKLKKLCAYRVVVERDKIRVIEMSTDYQVFVHPPISEESKARIISEFKPRTDVKPQEIMIEFVKQMAADSQEKEKCLVLVGMEIHTTQISLMNGNFMCAFGIPIRLDGFDEKIKEMAKDQEIKLITRAHQAELDELDRLFKVE